MILVDTNVWSELLRPEPMRSVQLWEKDNADDLWLSTVVIGELLSGVHFLPEGRRKDRFLVDYDNLIEAHSYRIAAFDIAAALLYGPTLAYQEKAGRNPGTADTQIAATALARGFALATRNTKHFAGLGLKLINPWEG